ncbi:MAG: hypothetical protein KF817_15435 [Phycisphaeraceae bacterium]|nr:hypothetical protein [Phycisphaeraceae bacterium]
MTDRTTAPGRRTAVFLLLSACMAGTPITAHADPVSRAAGDDSACPVETPDARHTLRMDPVCLVRGEAVEGLESIPLVHRGYRYLFRDAATRAQFEADPTRFEIRLGGACARMGPLSGEGSATIFTVYDGAIYIFASEACRATFIADPEKFLERDDTCFATTDRDAAAAQRLLARAIEAHGGPERIGALRSARWIQSRDVSSGDRTWKVRRSLLVLYPDDCTMEESWDDSGWSTHLEAGGGRFASGSGPDRAMHPQQVRAAERVLHRDLLWLLRAAVDRIGAGLIPGPDAGWPIADEHGTPIAADFCRCHWRGSTVRVAFDRASGRIIATRSRDRGPDHRLAEVERLYAGATETSGIILPDRVITRVSGTVVAAQSGGLAIVIDESPGNSMESRIRQP